MTQKLTLPEPIRRTIDTAYELQDEKWEGYTPVTPSNGHDPKPDLVVGRIVNEDREPVMEVALPYPAPSELFGYVPDGLASFVADNDDALPSWGDRFTAQCFTYLPVPSAGREGSSA